MSLEITPTQKQSRPESGQSLAIVPVNKSERAPDLDSHILAMFLLWAKAPRKAQPEPDGSFWLGEIGHDALPDQRLLRDTPYSICRGIRES
jgi:hypothetical protein